MSKEETPAVPPGSKNSWASFLRSIASFNGDLSSLTAPAFILGTTSLTEFSAYWSEHPAIFVAPTKEPDPTKRAILVLKWFLTTLKQQYCSRSDKLGSEKKPLNPFLGELFLGKWEDQSEIGETTLVSEQVSHHPPVTAYCIRNDKHGIQLQGYNAQKASFSRTINVKQIGHALLQFTPPGSSSAKLEPETYLFTLPSLHIESLLTGAPFVELNGSTHITSSTGYVAKIDYSGRGWLSGKKNTFSASLWKEGEGDEKNPLYTADGQWNDQFVIREGKKGKEVDSHSAKTLKTTPLTVAPIEEQDLWESRRAWRYVAQSIQKGDLDSASYYKSRIENAQRALRKRERDDSGQWKRKFFRRVDESEETDFQKLAKKVTGSEKGASIEAEKTGGIWRFDPEKASAAIPPYHPEAARGLGENEDSSSASASRTTTRESVDSQKM